MLESGFPVRLVQSPSREDDVVFRLLCSKDKCLVIIVLDDLTVLSGDHLPLHGVLILCEERCLNEHGRDEVDAF